MTETAQQWLRDNALRVLDSAVDAIITIDAKGIIQSVNRATLTMFGFAKQQTQFTPCSIRLCLSLMHQALCPVEVHAPYPL